MVQGGPRPIKVFLIFLMHNSCFPGSVFMPLNSDSFISLTNNQHFKINRQTYAHTIPAENNSYFDDKVLSRQHTEIWEENTKVHCCYAFYKVGCIHIRAQVFIKAFKSSNGTFINGKLLSPEGLGSKPYELNSDNIVVCIPVQLVCH
jgi:pSer/pThr/pTyr-binding forkhead associated (FHA) protein